MHVVVVLSSSSFKWEDVSGMISLFVSWLFCV